MKNTSTITSKGQVTIPKKIRSSFNLSPNQKVSFYESEGKIILKPVKPISELSGYIKDRSNKKITDVKKIRKEVQKKVAEEIAKDVK